LVWNGDLPRPLQQILFETADGMPSPVPAPRAGLAPVSRDMREAAGQW
jgi:hypothetical protein